MDRLTKKVLGFIRENRLIDKGDQIAVGLSGGADSVSLIIILNNIKALLGIELCAIHINHGLRGDEADRDEAFCERLCARLGVSFASEKVDVRGMVKVTGMSEEEAARVLRYEAIHRQAERVFVSAVPENWGDRLNVEAGSIGKSGRRIKIAVAHHADDQAETILFNMLRGSGMRGLGGMRPSRDDIIRPLLCVGRDEILAYLEELGQDYVTDSTNLQNDHTRNIIRNVVMPELKENVNKRSAEHITELGNRIFEADEYIRKEAVAFLDTCAELSLGRSSGDDQEQNRAVGPEKVEIENHAVGYEKDEIKNRAVGLEKDETENRAVGLEKDETENRAVGLEKVETENCAVGPEKVETENGSTRLETSRKKYININALLLKEKAQVFRIYVIIEALRMLDIPLKDWGDRHFKDIDRLLFLGKGAHADLPAGVKADRTKGCLVISAFIAKDSVRN